MHCSQRLIVHGAYFTLETTFIPKILISQCVSEELLSYYLQSS
jgi:hypothetical protein